MTKKHIIALDYIRGISMLGVVGIHTGAFSLASPDINPHLFALFEIVSRFSVPIFFFVSAFGLFISQPLKEEFHYLSFMRRRFNAVLLPYIAWSLIYMWHYTWATGDTTIWEEPLVYHYFIFGLASYQLYFLVILIWFYALMPLWRWLVRQLLKSPVTGLLLLLTGQIIFNYYSSYSIHADSANKYINLAIQFRMSYWVLHYVFIFILGAVCAELYPKFCARLEQNKQWINAFFSVTLAGMLTFYYYLVYFKQYKLESAVNTVHQLSPIGVLYTVGATLFLFKIFSKPLPNWAAAILSNLGKHSYLVYLVHPLVMYYVNFEIHQAAILLTDPVVIAFYLATIAISIGIASLVGKLGQLIPPLGLTLTGSLHKPNTFRQKA
ncbi:hypothetical protein SRRS_28480 [Sporomusa rhizae]|uniref:acyltransferase n=1 Tax=Sporomusa rhizae TaxID=357999 RepID=UPI003529F538